MIEQKTVWEALGINENKWYDIETLSGEKWKDIKGYEKQYQVSSFGRIKSLSRIVNLETRQGIRERIRVLGTNPKGYSVISLCSGHCESKTVTVHRVVANAFISNVNNLPEINHINLIKQDNQINNLEWVTSKQNTHHSWMVGKRNPASGEKHGMAKLTNNQVSNIREMYNTGKFTQWELAKTFGVYQGAIYSIINYITWKNI